MAIVFSCPQCSKRLKAPDDAIGRLSKCPDCGMPVACPEPGVDGELSADPMSRRERAAEMTESFRTLLSAQRKLLISILTSAVAALVMMILGALADRGTGDPTMVVVAGFAAFAMMLAGAIGSLIYTYVLASRLFNVSAAIVLAAVVLVPYLGFVILFMMNRRVTQTLEDNGYEVGLLGVKRS